MKKAFLVIMSFVVALSFPAYAGVVSGVRPPDTTKSETKTDTSTKQDTSSKQDTTQSAKQNETVKQNETQSQNQSDSSWLFPNGIAKAPSYLDTKIVHEGKDLDDSSNLYLPEKDRTRPGFASGSTGLNIGKVISPIRISIRQPVNLSGILSRSGGKTAASIFTVI